METEDDNSAYQGYGSIDEYDPDDPSSYFLLPTPRPMRAPRRKGKTQNKALCVTADFKPCPGYDKQCPVCTSEKTEDGGYSEGCVLEPCKGDCKKHLDGKCVPADSFGPPDDITASSPAAPRRKTQNKAMCMTADGKICPGTEKQCLVCTSTGTDRKSYKENCKLGPCKGDCKKQLDGKCVPANSFGPPGGVFA